MGIDKVSAGCIAFLVIGSALADTLTGSARVIDADTLEISGERIRLEGIDAPESAQMCADGEGRPYPCGREATAALRALLGAQDIRCETQGRDRYGRWIAFCYLGARDVNAWLVEQGHAVAYRKHSDYYVPEEIAAREARRGVWQGRFVMPWEWRRGKRLHKGSLNLQSPTAPPEQSNTTASGPAGNWRMNFAGEP